MLSRLPRAAGSGGGEEGQGAVKTTATLEPPKPNELLSTAIGSVAALVQFGGLHRDLDAQVVLGIVQVDGRRRHPVAQGEDGGH